MICSAAGKLLGEGERENMEFKGIAPVVATPFTQGGLVDEDSLQNLLRVLVRGGCHALTLFGAEGEYYKLSDREMERMARIMIDECHAGGVPAIVCVTRQSTELAVRQARTAEAAGADCLLLLPPFFRGPDASDIAAHVIAAGRAVSVPVMVRYAPGRSGPGIPPSVFAEISRAVPNVCSYQIECRPVGTYLSGLLEAAGHKASIFVGDAGRHLPEALDRGAAGAMPGCSLYDVFLDIYRFHSEGRRADAVRLHNKLLPMLNHIWQAPEMGVRFEKRILKKRGIIESDYCRRPGFISNPTYDALFEEHFDRLKQHFSK